jgi:hypothetical protein
MASNLPVHLKSALDHLSNAAAAVEKKPVDVLHLPWGELEKVVIKLLGGGFNIEQPEHQALAMGLAAVVGERLGESDQAFWFPNRESPEAAMVGFPSAILMLSPLSTVLEALSKSQLTLLESVFADVRRSLAASKFSLTGGTAPRIGPEDYRRLFDAGFVQVLRADTQRLKNLFEAKPGALLRDFRDALGRAKDLPKEAVEPFDQQVSGVLAQLDQDKPLGAQVEKATRLVELLLHLFATDAATGAAPEEFWHEVAVPLLHIGAPTQFPPLDQEELDLAGKGAEPLALYLDVVPYQKPAVEEGVLGMIPPQDVALPHDGLGRGAAPPRILKVNATPMQTLLKDFDAKKTKASVESFTQDLSKKVGRPLPSSEGAQHMFDASLLLLTDLKQVVDGVTPEKSVLCIRRITEAEATSEGPLLAVRKALQGPRLIL